MQQLFRHLSNHIYTRYYMEPYVKVENIQVGLNKQAPESTVVQRIRAVAKAAGPGELLIWAQSSWINL